MADPSKRKRDTEDAHPPNTKRAAKRRKSKKPKDLDEGDLNIEEGVNDGIGRMDPQLLADLVAQRTKRFDPNLSLMELEDRNISASAIRDTSDWDKPRTLENLPAFLESLSKDKLSEAPEGTGRPHTLFVTAAGIRAADTFRALQKFRSKDAMVAKIFAKHIKLREAVESCNRIRMNIGVGTPQRVFDLLENGALSIVSLKRIVIDASHIDQKKRGILDMKETHLPLIQLLTRSDLKVRYGAKRNPIEISFY